MGKSNPLKTFNDSYAKKVKAFDKGGPKTGPNAAEYNKAVTAGQKAGYSIDQAGAYAAGHDTTSNTMLRSPDKKYFAQVKKPKK